MRAILTGMVLKITRRSSHPFALEQRAFDNLLHNHVIPHLKRRIPALVVLMMPLAVDDETLESLRVLAPSIVVWSTDSLARFPGHLGLRELASRCYVMDRGDALDSKDRWLPLGFDEKVFQPADEPPLHDVLFVGNIMKRNYETRNEYFRHLRNSGLARRHRIGFVGGLPSRVRNRLKWAGGGIEWVSRHLCMELLAAAIARSRVCIDIHQDDGVEPVNPMFFAIPAAGSCLISDRRPYLESWLRPEQEYVPCEAADLAVEIEALLRNEGRRSSIAAQGCRASAAHTYSRRAATILRDLGMIPDGANGRGL